VYRQQRPLADGRGLLQHLAPSTSTVAVDAFSAGSHPKPLHPGAARAMREHGIELGGRRSKHLREFAGQRFDYVISLCDRVRERCPEFPGHPERIHWSMPDPAHSGGGSDSGGDSDEDTYPAFQQTAAELATRVRFLVHRIQLTSTRTEPTRHARR